MAGFTEEDARQICLTGYKHEEHDGKLNVLGTSLFVGLFGLDSTSFTGFCMFIFFFYMPQQGHTNTHAFTWSTDIYNNRVECHVVLVV